MRRSDCKLNIADCRSSFTLIEMLLVLAIIGITTAIVIPNYVQSMKGNRLRTAVRTVVKAGRYARSIAVLKQVPITITFDLTDTSVSVEGGEGRDNIKRTLDRVSVEYVQSTEEDRTIDGKYSLVYQTNGRCKPYEVKIVDNDGSAVLIKVDALATAETEAVDE